MTLLHQMNRTLLGLVMIYDLKNRFCKQIVLTLGSVHTKHASSNEPFLMEPRLHFFQERVQAFFWPIPGRSKPCKMQQLGVEHKTVLVNEFQLC
jgi:hypothetical protein